MATSKVTKKPATKKPVKTTGKQTMPKTKTVPKKSTKPVKKSAYTTTTDKVGDILVNQAGVKFKITGERMTKPSGYDDGKLKIRMLELTPDKKTGIKPFETLDLTLKHYRESKILKRANNEK